MRFAYPVDIATADVKDNATVGSYSAPGTTEDDRSVSLLYSTLPQLIQRRIPRLRSLRQAASSYTLSKGHHRAASDASLDSVATDATPPPVYRTQPPSPELSSESDAEDEVPEHFISAPVSQPASPGSITSVAGFVTRASDDTVWSKSGRYGFSLVKLALDEAASPAPCEAVGRRLYIDGIGYLLRGLPKDLSADEEVVLRAALPERLASNMSDEALASGQPCMQGTQEPTEPTLLRRTSSACTLYTILALSFLIPYLQSAMHYLWQFNRQHKLSERCFAQVATLAQLLSVQCVAVLALAWDINDGHLRSACRDTAVWLLRDVSGGANEGVGMAIERMRVNDRDDRNTST